MQIVEVWPRGYAHETGLKFLEVEDGVTREQAGALARKAFGIASTVYSMRPKNPPVPPPVSEAYARMMSQKDNS